MITTEYGYKQTLELIESMEKAIKSLREELKDKPKWLYDLMAEGPEEEIKKLQAEADEYLRLQRKAS